ncbi:MAG: phage Gp37/Gp68 family protein [Luteolibacter sp.]
MAENSSIEWCDHTFNPWTGCAKVSPGCAHCYAESFSKRAPKTIGGWGKGVPRLRTSENNWRNPLKWNRNVVTRNFQEIHLKDGRVIRDYADKIAKMGILMEDIVMAGPVRPRVFCASMADWLDDEVPIQWLADLLQLICQTPNLDWLLLTKRPENWLERVMFQILETDRRFADFEGFPEWLYDWKYGNPPPNVWIGTSVENQAMAERRIPNLLNIPAKVRFLSCEPLLGSVDLRAMKFQDHHPLFRANPLTGAHLRDGLNESIAYPNAQKIHWVICGGESGHGARPMRPDWARSLRDQCQAAGVPFLFKQWGEFGICPPPVIRGMDGNLVQTSTFKSTAHYVEDQTNHEWLERMGKKAAGRLLGGREWNEFPKTGGQP